MASTLIRHWLFNITTEAENYPAYWHLLSPTEQDRAKTITHLQRHKRYVESQARLRILLGDILNTAPHKLRINKAEQGKPYLVDYPNFAFNLSHTSNKLIVAVGENCALGVDIEECKPRNNLHGLVEKCFSEVEKKHWLQLSAPQQQTTFYQFWTRKEAFVKAVGVGITLGLKHCIVNPNQPSKFLALPNDYGNVNEWLIQNLCLDKTLCGAIVAKTEFRA